MSPPKLWGGVFGKDTDQVAWAFGQSIHSDLNLFEEEVEVSIAHAQMLGKCELLTSEEVQILVEGLSSLFGQYKSNTLAIDFNAEDIHSFIETCLTESVGQVAKKLHSGRSRNDQIATVSRLWLKKRCGEINGLLAAMMAELLGLAKVWKAQPIPGYTHQQHAMPITLGHQFLAYFWMLDRDRTRFKHVAEICNSCPLGSAALGGTSIPIDRQMTSQLLGFDRPIPNSLDAVSDRDFIGDAMHASATLMQHLSRICQDIVLFSMAEMGYLQLDDSLSTGSSIMPQKQNPDFAELIRGRASRAIGNWTTFMSMMKGLQTGYNRDQQEDKPPLFDSISLCQDSIKLTHAMLASATIDAEQLANSAGKGYANATGVCESLVKQGMAFRDSHELVGKLVRTAQQKKIPLDKLESSDLPPDSPPNLPLILSQSSVLDSLRARESEGGPGPQAMEHQISLATDTLQNKTN